MTQISKASFTIITWKPVATDDSLSNFFFMPFNLYSLIFTISSRTRVFPQAIYCLRKTGARQVRASVEGVGLHTAQPSESPVSLRLHKSNSAGLSELSMYLVVSSLWIDAIDG